MVCYFISNQDSAFYQSDKFTAILRFVQQNPGLGKMKESADKFSMSFDNVKSVKSAMETLAYMEKV
jgi:transcription-repair coupling factor (superfamily II helicase)